MTALLLTLFLQATITATVKPLTSFQVVFDHDAGGDSTIAYRFWCDGAIVRNFLPGDLTKAATPNADGTVAITATVPGGLAVGTHSCWVSAFNGTSESAGVPIPLVAAVVSAAPKTPLHLRLVVQVGGG